MKGGMQAALALGVGYVLGRRPKMRRAAILAAAAATGGLGGLGGMALKRATRVLGSTEALGKFAPQLGELADTVRSDLMDAGKAAATAAVTGRIESLTDSLHERAELVRDPGAAAGEAGKTARSGAGEAARSADMAARRLRRRGQEAAGAEDAGEPRDDEGEPHPEEREEPKDDEPDDGELEAASVHRRTSTRRRSPVARAGR